jgi:hypothetical protein
MVPKQARTASGWGLIARRIKLLLEGWNLEPHPLIFRSSGKEFDIEFNHQWVSHLIFCVYIKENL